MNHLFRIITVLFVLAGASVVAADLSPMQKHNEVDVVSLSPNGKDVVLSLVETRPWDGDGKNLLDMQEKLKNYLNYVESGQLYKQYPEAKGRKVRFRLHAEHPPDAKTEQFIRLVKEKWLGPVSIEWETSILSK